MADCTELILETRPKRLRSASFIRTHMPTAIVSLLSRGHQRFYRSCRSPGKALLHWASEILWLYGHSKL